MNKTSVSVAIDDKTYTAELQGRQVYLDVDGVWAGAGTWDFEAEEITDCGATLGDDVYDALSSVLADRVMGMELAERWDKGTGVVLP